MSCLWGGADCCWRGKSGGCAGGDVMGVVEVCLAGKGTRFGVRDHEFVVFDCTLHGLYLVLRGGELYHRSIRYTRSKH